MLKIKNLVAGYSEAEVLKGISIHIKKDEIVALIGPNGAGKSTVIKAVYHLADIKRGDITFEGKSILNTPAHMLIGNGITYVNQGRINFSTLTVEENLEIGQEKSASTEERKEEIFNKFPVLREKKNEYAFTLSGGQQQMLALGRALMRKPKLLMLDEPSLGLSPKLQMELFSTIKNLHEDGIAILIVEQNAKKAIQMADRTYVLEDGRVALEGDKSIINHKAIKSVYLGGRY